MRYFKGLALAAVAAAAILVLGAGSASAAELYSTGVTVNSPATFHASLETGTMIVSATDGNTVIETCTNSTIEGSTGSYTGGPVSVSIESVTWGGCTFTKDTLVNGSLSIASDGTASGAGTVWTINIGVTCRYGFGAGTTLGTLSTGKLKVNAIINEQEPKVFLCPDTDKLDAYYAVTSPHDLTVK
jgi:hypothetical protein